MASACMRRSARADVAPFIRDPEAIWPDIGVDVLDPIELPPMVPPPIPAPPPVPPCCANAETGTRSRSAISHCVDLLPTPLP